MIYLDEREIFEWLSKNLELNVKTDSDGRWLTVTVDILIKHPDSGKMVQIAHSQDGTHLA